MSAHRLAWIPEGFERRDGAEHGPWLWLAMILGLVANVRAVYDGFYRTTLAVPDDARQFIYWMPRLFDAAALPDDLIADYFQSVSPPGFVAVYRFLTWAGIEPLLISKILVIPIAFAFVYFAYRLAYRLLPIPAVAFFATWLTFFAGWWSNGTLGSGTPRAFYAPLLLSVTFSLVVGSRAGVIVSVALLSLLYPQMAIFAVGVICLHAIDWSGFRPRPRWRAVATAAISFVVMLVAVLPFAQASREYGPTITLEEARAEATFQDYEKPFRGRTAIFRPDGDWWRQHVIDGRLGFLPGDWRQPIRRGTWPAIDRAWEVWMLSLVFGLPILLIRRSRQHRVDAPRPEVRIFADVVAASTILYAIALALLFHLHVPSRYSTNPINLFVPMALILAIAPWLQGLARWIMGPVPERGGAVRCLALGCLAAAVIVTFPLGKTRGFTELHSPGLYRSLARTPPDSRIALLAEDGGSAPVFAKRSILVSREHLVPYSRGYFLQMKQRITHLVRTIYELDTASLRTLIDEYGVDYVVVWESEGEARAASWWIGVVPEATDAYTGNGARLDSVRAAWRSLADRCAFDHADGYAIVDARCALRDLEADPFELPAGAGEDL